MRTNIHSAHGDKQEGSLQGGRTLHTRGQLASTTAGQHLAPVYLLTPPWTPQRRTQQGPGVSAPAAGFPGKPQSLLPVDVGSRPITAHAHQRHVRKAALHSGLSASGLLPPSRCSTNGGRQEQVTHSTYQSQGISRVRGLYGVYYHGEAGAHLVISTPLFPPSRQARFWTAPSHQIHSCSS